MAKVITSTAWSTIKGQKINDDFYQVRFVDKETGEVPFADHMSKQEIEEFIAGLQELIAE